MAKGSGQHQLFVGRLPRDMRSSDLERIFEKFGKLTRCDIKRGVNLCYGFIEYDDEANAGDALKECDGMNVHGERIVVEFAKGAARKHNDNACFRCGREGHWARDCPSARRGGRSRSPRRSRSRSRSHHRSSRRSRHDRSRSRSRSRRGHHHRRHSRSRSRSPRRRSRSRDGRNRRSSRKSHSRRSQSRSRSDSRSGPRSGSRSFSNRLRSTSRSPSPNGKYLDRDAPSSEWEKQAEEPNDSNHGNEGDDNTAQNNAMDTEERNGEGSFDGSHSDGSVGGGWEM